MVTTPGKTDETEWVARARGGEREAFSQLVVLHQDAVYRVVRRTSAVDEALAEDLAQETFLRAWRALASFRGDSSFLHWLLTIATNLTINRRSTVAAKAERRALSLDRPGPAGTAERIDPVDARQPAPAARALGGELKAALARALERLPEEFRAAVVLRDVEGLEYDAIAAVLAVPIGTVRSRIHRGRDQLREILTRIYGEPAFPAGADGIVR